MGRKNTIAIDGEKLRAAIAMTGKAMSEISRECGYQDDYIGAIIKAGITNATVITLLEKLFGIDPALYIVPKEPEKAPEPPHECGWVETADALREAVRAAILDQTVLTELTMMLKAAVRGGMIDAREEMMRRAKQAGGNQ